MKDSMKRFVVVASVGVFVSSCGNSKNSDKKKEDKFVQTTYVSKRPYALYKQVKDCIPGERAFENSLTFSVPQFLGGRLAYTSIDFTEQINHNYVQSPLGAPISLTTYGQEISFSATLKFKNGKYELSDDFKQEVVSKGENLSICPGELAYGEFSYESAGLNVSNSISKTYKKVTELGYYLSPVTLNIAPILKQEFTYSGGKYDKVVLQSFEADNAYYHPIDKEITFLPQSHEYQEKVDDNPFWQMPMVGSHEYGHHIFTSFVSEKISTKIKHSKNCFEGASEAKSLIAGEGGDDRTPDAAFALRSLNEGFADLIARYTLSPEEASMKNLRCFELNRDVGVDHFGDNTSKAFTSTVTGIIDSKEKIAPPKSCDNPNFQEVHHVGASFANAAYKIIGSSTDDTKVSLKILMEFANELANTHEAKKHLSASDYIYHALNIVLDKSNELTSNSTEDYNCEMLQKVFPAKPIELCKLRRAKKLD